MKEYTFMIVAALVLDSICAFLDWFDRHINEFYVKYMCWLLLLIIAAGLLLLSGCCSKAMLKLQCDLCRAAGKAEILHKGMVQKTGQVAQNDNIEVIIISTTTGQSEIEYIQAPIVEDFQKGH